MSPPTLLDEVVGATLSLGALVVGGYSLLNYRYRASTLDRAGYCSRCAGEGMVECTLCYGRGSIAQPGYVNVADPYNRSKCKRCEGSGKHECRVCSGSGKAAWLESGQASASRPAPPPQPLVVEIPPNSAAAAGSRGAVSASAASPSVSPVQPPPPPSLQQEPVDPSWAALEQRLGGAQPPTRAAGSGGEGAPPRSSKKVDLDRDTLDFD